ncbi:hypothetical protein [Chloroherpeton thalassium]|nr:hypothetical protein [Chloroherpeton thalassium]
MGGFFAAILHKKSLRTKKKDKLQARALMYATFATLALSSKGLFFIVGTLSFVNIIPAIYFPPLYWFGWHISLLWFLCFGYLFGLTFARSKKSYDTYYVTGIIFLFLFLTIFYNDRFFGVPLLPFHKTLQLRIHENTSIVEASEVFFQNSLLLTYSVSLHLFLWIGLFLFVAYKIYRRARRYKDESAKRATALLAASFGGMGLIGIVWLLLLSNNLSLLITLSFPATLVIMVLFYFSIINIYKHGRYSRL